MPVNLILNNLEKPVIIDVTLSGRFKIKENTKEPTTFEWILTVFTFYSTGGKPFRFYVTKDITSGARTVTRMSQVYWFLKLY